MIQATRHERPGVYSSYETSSLTAASVGGGKVAVIAAAPQADKDTVYQWTSYSRASGDVGDCALSRLAQLAIRNGAGTVYGVPVQDGDYEAAFAAAAAIEDAGILVCDSTELTVQQALKTMVQECSAARRERIAVVGGAAGETADALVKRAAQLNCERMVLVAPAPGTAPAAPPAPRRWRGPSRAAPTRPSPWGAHSSTAWRG